MTNLKIPCRAAVKMYRVSAGRFLGIRTDQEAQLSLLK